MKNPHVLVDINEASAIAMKFIGTDTYNDVVSSLENNAKAGFNAGLFFAICLAMAECKTFLYHMEEQSGSN